MTDTPHAIVIGQMLSRRSKRISTVRATRSRASYMPFRYSQAPPRSMGGVRKFASRACQPSYMA